MIVESLKRLSVATNKLNVTASNLWGKINAIMTDAVSKDLKIEDEVADVLQSRHVSYHILCKSHTCERQSNDSQSTQSKGWSK